MKATVERFIFAGFTANCYALIAPNGDLAVVDVGGTSDAFTEFLRASKSKIRYYLLSHNHFDHICGLPEAIKTAPAPIIIHKDDEKGLFDSTLSLCNEVGMPQPVLPQAKTVNDGDRLPFGNSFIKALHTPGHTVGGACYLYENILFSGDTLFKNGVGRTDFITGSLASLQLSLKRLSKLPSETIVYPGHGESTTIQNELDENPYLTF